MTKRTLFILLLVLVLLAVATVAAQSSLNYASERSVLLSGGQAGSANYTVDAVIGQPAVGVVTGGNYRVSAGFLHPRPGSGNRLFLPVALK